MKSSSSSTAWAAHRSWNCTSSTISYKDYRLRNKAIAVYDTMVGNYMTSIEMAGFSITLLRLDDELKGSMTHRLITLGLEKIRGDESLDTEADGRPLSKGIG
mgnify:CR=1 FL=1